jgi:hypothetical protein
MNGLPKFELGSAMSLSRLGMEEKKEATGGSVLYG